MIDGPVVRTTLPNSWCVGIRASPHFGRKTRNPRPLRGRVHTALGVVGGSVPQEGPKTSCPKQSRHQPYPTMPRS
jgi:hypothetical protein